MHRRQRRLAAVAASAMLSAMFAAASANAQSAGACCLPDETCILVASAWACSREGGVYLGSSSTCCDHPCADPYVPGYGMSQTAARRLVREGVVHTLWTYGPIEVYKADHPMWIMHGIGGHIIAPHIWVDLRHHPHADPETSAENVADAVLAAAGDALEAWNDAWACRESPPGAPFAWSLRLEALGQPFTWSLGTANGEIPTFSNHAGDVIDGRLNSRQFISGHHSGQVGQITGARSFKVHGNHWGFFGQLTQAFYLNPNAAIMTVGGKSAAIESYDPVEREFTLVSSYDGTLVADEWFSVSRNDDDYPGLKPCYFFKNGSAELGTWIEAFCARMATATWPEGLPEPVAVIVPTEDVGAITVDWENYLEYLDDDKAKGDVNGSGPNDGFTIDGVRNLEDWHAEYAKDRNGDPLVFVPMGSDYSPVNEDLHSYLGATFTTAYNHHREQSTWAHFRALWPRAILTQYLHGNGYGVTHGGVRHEVPRTPGASGYHGKRQWKESVNWDAYACITTPQFSTDLAGDGGQIPVWYESAQTALVTAGGGGASDEVPLLTALPFDPDWYLGEGIPLFVEFIDGPNIGNVYEVDGWDGVNQVLHLTASLASTSIHGNQFRIYYPFGPYFDYRTNGTKWPFIETYCVRYGEPVTAAGFLAASKKWAAEQARGQTRALPENPYTLTIGPGGAFGGYDGVGEQVSRLATYPHEPFTSQDGWLSGTDWGEVASQARDYGVNHFDWFVPGLIVNTAADPMNDPPIWEPSATMDTVFMAIYMMTGIGDTYLHYNIACIADWDKSGTITATDATAFMDDLNNGVLEADLNNDGLFDSADQAIFDAAFCVGDCAPIEHPGCTGSGPGTCEEAAWCGDSNVGIDDIYCFLSDWFANDPTARNYGGTEGVAAIFAFLSNWFSQGIGPCDP